MVYTLVVSSDWFRQLKIQKIFIISVLSYLWLIFFKILKSKNIYGLILVTIFSLKKIKLTLFKNYVFVDSLFLYRLYIILLIIKIFFICMISLRLSYLNLFISRKFVITLYIKFILRRISLLIALYDLNPIFHFR